jgi:hypothetical protein
LEMGNPAGLGAVTGRGWPPGGRFTAYNIPERDSRRRRKGLNQGPATHRRRFIVRARRVCGRAFLQTPVGDCALWQGSRETVEVVGRRGSVEETARVGGTCWGTGLTHLKRREGAARRELSSGQSGNGVDGPKAQPIPARVSAPGHGSKKERS